MSGSNQQERFYFQQPTPPLPPHAYLLSPMLTQSPTVDPIDGFKCPFCRNNNVGEPQAQCAACQKAATANSTTATTSDRNTITTTNVNSPSSGMDPNGNSNNNYFSLASFASALPGISDTINSAASAADGGNADNNENHAELQARVEELEALLRQAGHTLPSRVGIWPNAANAGTLPPPTMRRKMTASSTTDDSMISSDDSSSSEDGDGYQQRYYDPDDLFEYDAYGNVIYSDCDHEDYPTTASSASASDDEVDMILTDNYTNAKPTPQVVLETANDAGHYGHGHHFPAFQVPEARTIEDLQDPIRPKNQNITVDVPEELSSHLIQVFCANAYIFNFHKPIPAFLAQLQRVNALSLPPSHPDAPHPCLMNSALLLGCHFSPRRRNKHTPISSSNSSNSNFNSNVINGEEEEEEYLANFEEIFLAKTLRLVNEAQFGANGSAVGTAEGDRALDFCMALSLIARYCFYTNRFDTGVCFTNSAMSYAVGCGLHQIDIRSHLEASSSLSSSSSSTPGASTSTCTATGTTTIPPPRDEYDTIQRIRLWHSIFTADRGSSWVTGIPPFLADEDITTPWPVNSLRHGARVEQMRAQQCRLKASPSPSSLELVPQPPPMVPSLFLSGPESQARVLPGDTALSIRARGVAFLERSTYIARRVSAGDFASNGGGSFPDDSQRGAGSNRSYAGFGAGPTAIPTMSLSSTNDRAVDPSRLCSSFYARFREQDEALRLFGSSLPSLTPHDFSQTPVALPYSPPNDIDVTGEEFYDVDGGWSPAHSARTHTLIAGHATVLAASMQLHSILSETHPESHQKVLEDAMRTAELARATADMDPRSFLLTSTITFFVASRILLQELQYVRDPPTATNGSPVSHHHSPSAIEQMVNALRMIVHTHRRVLNFYQLTEMFVTVLEQDAANIGLTL